MSFEHCKNLDEHHKMKLKTCVCCGQEIKAETVWTRINKARLEFETKGFGQPKEIFISENLVEQLKDELSLPLVNDKNCRTNMIANMIAYRVVENDIIKVL